MRKSGQVMNKTEWSMLIVLSIIWGGSFFLARVAVAEVPPLTMVLVRVSLAAIVLSIILSFTGSNFTRNKSLWVKFAIMGILNNVIPFSLIFYGQKEIGAGLAAIINAMTPIWTVLIAHLVTSDERLSPGKIFGVISGFLGVATMIGAAAWAGLASSAIALLAVAAAAFSYGVASVFGRAFKSVPPIETARGQLIMSSLLVLPLVLWIDQPWQLDWPGNSTVAALIALAVICTAFAYILYFEILRRAGAVNIALVTFLVPVSAIILGMAFLDEVLLARHLLGMVLIMIGLLAIDGRMGKHAQILIRSRPRS